jgi:hypothetical protein
MSQQEEIGVTFTLDTRRKQRFDFMHCLYDWTEGSELGLVYIEEIAEEINLSELETEIVALYLADERLIKIRMRHIISITHLGIDAVETALAQPERPTEHFPALQAAATTTESATEIRRGRDRNTDNVFAPPPPPPKPLTPPVVDEVAAMELKRICEAIGLDPREITGELTPPAPLPFEKHELPGDLSLPSDLSEEIRKLIERAEATSAQTALSPPTLEDPLEPATPPVVPTRVQSVEQANTQPAQAAELTPTDVVDILASLKMRLLKIRLALEDMAEAEAEIATAMTQLLSPRPKPQIIALSLRTLLSILENSSAAALTTDVEVSLTRLRAFLSQLHV